MAPFSKLKYSDPIKNKYMVTEKKENILSTLYLFNLTSTLISIVQFLIMVLPNKIHDTVY